MGLNETEHIRQLRAAVKLSPTNSPLRQALADALLAAGLSAEATIEYRTALAAAPDADYHGMHAAIKFEKERWNDALTAAETGLQFDPEHVTCNNLRAMALVKLGRKTEAGETIAGTLARNPDNTHSHANQGWTLLSSVALNLGSRFVY